MAKKKPVPFKRGREEDVGLKGYEIKVKESWENGKHRIRTITRRAGVEPKDKFHDWPTWEEAEEFAMKLSHSLQASKKSHGGKVKDLDDNTLNRLKNIWSDFESSKVMGGKIPPMTYGVQHVEQPVTLERVFECGIMAIKAVNEVNNVLEKNDLKKYDFRHFLNNFHHHATSKVSLQSHIPMKRLIEQLKDNKQGAYGGRGNKSLGAAAKTEWGTQMDRLSSWIGAYSLGDDPKRMMEVITNMINQAKVPKGKRGAGQLLAGRTKEHIADKASQFGGWLVQEDYWKKNHFERLQKDFKYEDETEATIFTPAEVKTLFKHATKPEFLDLIPYLSFLFFAGCRPMEIACPNNKLRRFPWKWMLDYRIESQVTEGLMFNMKKNKTLGKDPDASKGTKQRISKWHKNRQADMALCGVEWIRWWACKKGLKSPPTSGEVWFDRPLFEKLRKDAGEERYWDEWGQDSARHSFASYAHWNNNWKVVEDYWHRKCGHTDKAYEKYYNHQVSQEDCDAYFNIMPPEIIRSDWPTEKEAEQFLGEFKK